MKRLLSVLAACAVLASVSGCRKENTEPRTPLDTSTATEITTADTALPSGSTAPAASQAVSVTETSAGSSVTTASAAAQTTTSARTTDTPATTTTSATTTKASSTAVTSTAQTSVTTTTTTVPAQPAAELTNTQKALRHAEELLKDGYSYDTLLERMEQDGYSHADALYAADYCGADWFEQAIRYARACLSREEGYSRMKLLEELGRRKFNSYTAEYAADHCGADWDTQALKQARRHLDPDCYMIYIFSSQNLQTQLRYEGFTEDQAQYAAEHCGADWNEQAMMKSREYKAKDYTLTRDDIIEKMVSYDGFTQEEAANGVTLAGIY